MKITVTAMALALSVSAPLSAQAATTSTASLHGFSVTLYDLNPGDGVAPSITFANSGAYGSYVRTSASDGAVGSQSNNAWSLQSFGPASASAAVGLAQASAAISGSLNGGGLTYSAQGSALGTALPNFPTNYSASASIGDFQGLTFSVSPYTLAVFNGTFDLFAQTTVGQITTTQPYYYLTENSGASASISVYGAGVAGSQGSQQSSQSRQIYAYSNQVYDPQTGQYTFTGQTFSEVAVPLAASFTNFTSGSQSGTLNLSLSVTGTSSIPAAVPEPATYAMMFAGLAVLLAARRRR